MEIRFSTNSHAVLLTASDERGDRRVVAAIPTSLEDADSPVVDLAIALRKGVESYASVAAHDIATYTPTVRTAKLHEDAIRNLAGPIQSAISGGRAAKREHVASRLRLLTVPTADATSALIRQHDREQFASLRIGDKAAWIDCASVDQLAAIIEAGRSRFADVTPEIWVIAEDRYSALNFIRMAGTAADFAHEPTAEDPLAIGIDMEAAEQAAYDGMERQRQRADAFKTLEQAIQGITDVVALTCDLGRTSAFTMLTSGRVPE